MYSYAYAAHSIFTTRDLLRSTPSAAGLSLAAAAAGVAVVVVVVAAVMEGATVGVTTGVMMATAVAAAAAGLGDAAPGGFIFWEILRVSEHQLFHDRKKALECDGRANASWCRIALIGGPMQCAAQFWVMCLQQEVSLCVST